MRTFPRLIVALWLMAGLAIGQAQDSTPKVVAAWASGPMEVRVAFDRVVDLGLVPRVVGRSVEFGEEGKPGGRVGGEKGTLQVAAATWSDDGRTLILVTDPHPRETTYKLALPGVKSPGHAGEGTRVDVTYDLGGVEVAWIEPGKTTPRWSGWWPVTDPSTAWEVVAKSSDHKRLGGLLGRTGRLTMRTLVKVPSGPSTLVLESASPFEVNFGAETLKSDQAHRATWKTESSGDPIDFSLIMDKPEGTPRLQLRLLNGPPLPRSAFLLPWAPATPTPIPLAETPATLLTGGDPAQGRAVFYGEAAKCANCHKVGGEGGAVGPDLTNLSGRDRAWIYQNIVEPSASIHPEFVTYTVALKDGTIAMGVVRAEGANALKVADIDAKQSVIPRSEVEEIRPSSTSIMPVGLLGAIGEERTRDLLAFLTQKR